MFLFSSVDCHLIVSTSAAPLDRFSLRPTQIPGDQIRSELLLTSQTREHLFVFLTDSSSDSSSSGKRNKKQILVLQDPSCCLTAPFYPSAARWHLELPSRAAASSNPKTLTPQLLHNTPGTLRNCKIFSTNAHPDIFSPSSTGVFVTEGCVSVKSGLLQKSFSSPWPRGDLLPPPSPQTFTLTLSLCV